MYFTGMELFATVFILKARILLFLSQEKKPI